MLTSSLRIPPDLIPPSDWMPQLPFVHCHSRLSSHRHLPSNIDPTSVASFLTTIFRTIRPWYVSRPQEQSLGSPGISSLLTSDHYQLLAWNNLRSLDRSHLFFFYFSDPISHNVVRDGYNVGAGSPGPIARDKTTPAFFS